MSSHEVETNTPGGLINQSTIDLNTLTAPVEESGDDASSEKIECITCDSLETYADLSEGYIEAVSLALYDPVLTVFASLVGLWVVVSGLQIWLAMVSPVHLMRDLYQKAKLINKKPSRPCEHF